LETSDSQGGRGGGAAGGITKGASRGDETSRTAQVSSQLCAKTYSITRWKSPESKAIMAAELGLNQQIAKRVGLFHDIGQGPSTTKSKVPMPRFGAELLKKYGEPEEVWQGVACHHHEVEPLTTYGVLARVAADAISAFASRSAQREYGTLPAAPGKAGGGGECLPWCGQELRVASRPRNPHLCAAQYRHGRRKPCNWRANISKKIEQELQYPPVKSRSSSCAKCARSSTPNEDSFSSAMWSASRGGGAVATLVPRLQQERDIDFVIANGENSAPRGGTDGLDRGCTA